MFTYPDLRGDMIFHKMHSFGYYHLVDNYMAFRTIWWFAMGNTLLVDDFIEGSE